MVFGRSGDLVHRQREGSRQSASGGYAEGSQRIIMQTPGTNIYSIFTTERFCWPARVGGSRSLVPFPESLWRETSRGSIFQL